MQKATTQFAHCQAREFEDRVEVALGYRQPWMVARNVDVARDDARASERRKIAAESAAELGFIPAHVART